MLANPMNIMVGALLDALLDTLFRARLDSSRTIPDTAKQHPSRESIGTTRGEIYRLAAFETCRLSSAPLLIGASVGCKVEFLRRHDKFLGTDTHTVVMAQA